MMSQPSTSSQQDLRGFIPAPSKATELVHFTRDCLDRSLPESDRRKRELFLQYVAKTQEKFRSPYQTTMMLMGTTGAGKSSTGNHLLNSNILSVSDSTSDTRCVSEYAATSSSRALKVSNLRLSLVDTPGLSDVSGINQDACNMWAIKKFLQQCNNVAGRAVYPNIILLCIKADDNRYEGPESQFVKNLKLLRAMGVIDSQNPNVVMVLTHACSIPHRNVESWKKKLDKRAIAMQDILQSKLGFRAPYVFLENEFLEWGLQSDAQNSGTVLPDESVQPTDLYFAIMDLLRRNGDEFAYLTMRQFYKQGSQGQSFRENRDTNVLCKIASEEALDKDEEACLQVLLDNSEAYQHLLERFQTERNEHREMIEMSRNEMRKQLDSFIESKALDPRNPSNFPVCSRDNIQTIEGSHIPPFSQAGHNELRFGNISSQQPSTDDNVNQTVSGNNLYNIRATGRAMVVINTPLPLRDERYSTAQLALALLGVACVAIVGIVYAPAIAAASTAAAASASSAASAAAAAASAACSTASTAAAAAISSCATTVSAAAGSAVSTALSIGGNVINYAAGSSVVISVNEMAGAVAPVVLGALGRAASYLR